MIIDTKPGYDVFVQSSGSYQHTSNNRDQITAFPNEYQMHRELLMKMMKDIGGGAGQGGSILFIFFFA